MGSYDLTSAANVKAFEGITVAGDDTLIGNLIERVSAMFETYTERKLFGRTYNYEDGDEDAILDGLTNFKNDQILVCPQYPIISVSTVRINETAYDETTSVYDSGWFIKSKKRGMIGLRGYSWLAGANNIELKYTAGYASGSIPADLEQACIEQVLMEFKRGKKEHLLGIQSISQADGSVTRLSGALLPSVRQVLDRYRRVTFG